MLYVSLSISLIAHSMFLLILLQCLQRDSSKCIFMQTKNPECCHIFPFAANSSERNLGNLRETLSILHCLIGDQRRLLISEVACSDRVWNMLSLNRQLHKWWSMGLLALRCLGVLPIVNQGDVAEVTIQLHWIPKRIEQQAATLPPSQAGRRAEMMFKPLSLQDGEGEALWSEWSGRLRVNAAAERLTDVLVEVDGDFDDGSKDDDNNHDAGDSATRPAHYRGCVAANIPETGRLLLTGATATLRMPLEEAYNMKAMLDLQWSLMMIATMSGAMDLAELLRHRARYHDDEDGDGDGEASLEYADDSAASEY